MASIDVDDSLSAEETILAEELEILEAIYITELEIYKESDKMTVIELQLHPSTGDNVEEQYVCLTLQFRPSEKYPDELPEILIKNPRGLAEEHVNSLRQELHDEAEERRGGHMLYDLIEHAKESLTKSNIPHCPCAVCLEPFTTEAEFTRTECYHYFHNFCLRRHVEAAESVVAEANSSKLQHQSSIEKQEVGCPVCRKTISYDRDALQKCQRPSSPEFKFKPDREMLELQKKMATLFQKQKARGGIIDLEEEKNKFLLSEATSVVGNTDAPNMELDSNDKGHGESDSLPEENTIGSQNINNQKKVHKTCESRGRGRGRPMNGSHNYPRHQPRWKDDKRDSRWKDDKRDYQEKSTSDGYSGRKESRDSVQVSKRSDREKDREHFSDSLHDLDDVSSARKENGSYQKRREKSDKRSGGREMSRFEKKMSRDTRFSHRYGNDREGNGGEMMQEGETRENDSDTKPTEKGRPMSGQKSKYKNDSDGHDGSRCIRKNRSTDKLSYESENPESTDHHSSSERSSRGGRWRGGYGRGRGRGQFRQDRSNDSHVNGQQLETPVPASSGQKQNVPRPPPGFDKIQQCS